MASGEQPRSWLRGNPWQCDFNLKSQISMPGTQAARALWSRRARALTAHTAHTISLDTGIDIPSRPATLPNGFYFFVVVHLIGVLEG